MFASLAVIGIAAVSISGSVAFSFETCTTKNNYLEAELARIYAKRNESDREMHCALPPGEPIETKVLPALEFEKFPLECIYASMKNLGMVGKWYWHCREIPALVADPKRRGAWIADPSGKKATTLDRDLEKPCVSRNYVSYVHESFVKAMECAGLDPYETFPLINEESGFQLNVGRGGNGISQMNAGAMGPLNRSGYLKKLLEDGGDRCKPVLELARKFDGQAKLTIDPPSLCQYVELPYNPALSFLYFSAYYKERMERVSKVVAELSRNRYSEDQLRSIRLKLTRMCYGSANECDDVLSAFRQKISTTRIAASLLDKALADATIEAGTRLEQKRERTEVLGLQTKEFIEEFPHRIERKLNLLGSSTNSESLARKCSKAPENANRLRNMRLESSSH